jgi:checkpoint serine/threonine-protein kinase
VYPNANDPTEEFSFEELRAINRGWAARDWRKEPASPLRMISINIQPSPPQSAEAQEGQAEKLGLEVKYNPILDDENSSRIRPLAEQQLEVKETKPAKAKRLKVREIKQETQTGKLPFVSSGPN